MRPVLPSLALVALALGSSACASAEAAGARSGVRPNVVLILADDLGYGDVSANTDDGSLPTPRLDALAAEGLRFTDGHSPSAVCTPTRYALLTGRYCWRTSLTSGVLGGYSPPLLEPGRATLGDLMRRAGYRTAAVGKWHLGMDLPYLDPGSADRRPWSGDPGIDWAGTIGDGPTHHGFDRYFGVSASLDMAPYVFVRDDRFDEAPTLQQPGVPFPWFVREGPRAEGFVIDRVLDDLVDEARDVIADWAHGPAPFFLYLPLTAPHKPAQPHARFRGSTGLGEYGDFVAQVDDAVGAVLDALDEAGVAQDTLVVVTSDNGSYMHRYDDPQRADHVDDPAVQGYRADRHRANGPLRGTKADVYEAGHRVPLIVRWPGTIAPGRTSQETVCHTDWYATLAEITGQPLPDDEGEDSVSLLPLLRGTPFRRGVPLIHHSANGMFALREGPWKLVAGNGSGGREQPRGEPFAEPYQLYDLSQDLGERSDLIDVHPAVAARLSERLEAIRAADRSAPARN